MVRLEDVRNGALVRGIAPAQAVQIVSVDWIGNRALNVVFRGQDGLVSETTLYRADEDRPELDAPGRPWSFDDDGSQLRLGVAATRINPAHPLAPYPAITT